MVYGQLPELHYRTHIPQIATYEATIIAFVLPLIGRLDSLSLNIFSLVNLALWRIKIRDPEPMGMKVFPIWIPITGFFVSLAFILIEITGFLVNCFS